MSVSQEVYAQMFRKWGLSDADMEKYLPRWMDFITTHFECAAGIHAKAWLYWWGAPVTPPVKMHIYEERRISFQATRFHRFHLKEGDSLRVMIVLTTSEAEIECRIEQERNALTRVRLILHRMDPEFAFWLWYIEGYKAENGIRICSADETRFYSPKIIGLSARMRGSDECDIDVDFFSSYLHDAIKGAIDAYRNETA